MLLALLMGLATYIFIGFCLLIYHLAIYLTAAHFGIIAEAISIGFGPTIYRKALRNGVLTIQILPLSGYTRFASEFPLEESLDIEADLASTSALEEQARQFKDASVLTRMIIMASGPLASLALGCILVFLPIGAAAPQLAVTSPDQSLVQPCAVPGLTLLNEPSSWDGQAQLFRNTAIEFTWRLMTFQSLEGWGGFMGLLVTTGLMGAISGWAWLTCMGIVNLFFGYVNLIPVPAFTGGNLAFLAIEGMIGRPVQDSIRLALTYIGLLAILVFGARFLWIDLRWFWQTFVA